MFLMANRSEPVLRRRWEPRKLRNTVTSADIAGVSLRTIYRWVRENRVEWLRTPSGQLRIFEDSLLRRPPEE